MLWRATVQREDPAKPIGFSPKNQQAQIGDSVFWYNEDKDQQHQPYPEGQTPGFWGGVIEPHNSSEQVNLGTAGTINYKCGFHEDEEGNIIVANAVLIAAGADPLFGPVSITSGQCVSWGNSDANAHQPCPDTGDPWFPQPINPGDLSASITFNQAKGTTVNYHCAIHPDEKGSVTVSS
jgi:plastocyanin